jgi:hypothetical protein
MRGPAVRLAAALALAARILAQNPSWSWETKTVAPASLVGASGACADELCYVTGGSTVPQADPGSPPVPVATDDVWTFNISSGVWAPNTAPLILPRSGHSSVVVWDSPTHYTLWVIGGQQRWDDQQSDFSPFVDVEYYDADLGAWQVGPSLPVATSRIGCAVVNTTIFCVGGVIVYTDPSGDTIATVTDTVRSLDTSNPQGGWTLRFTFPVPVSQAGIAAAGNTIYVAGGTCFWAQCICEAGVPPALRGPRTGGPALPYADSPSYMLPTGSALPIPCKSPALTPSVYMWDTTTQSGWIGVAPLRLPRCGGGAFFDPLSSRLFYAGGASGSDNVAATVEVFDTRNLTAGWTVAPIQPVADVAAAWGGITRYRAGGEEERAAPSSSNSAPGRPVAWMAMGVTDIINIVPTNITAVLYDTAGENATARG